MTAFISTARDGLFLILGAILALSILDAFPAESDAQKWARLAKAKEERRVIERRYEACVTTCREGCVK